jgi:segregation and condensation protein A
VAYEVKLDVFEGPIDLLLHLVTRQRVDIYDVSLARITEEYLAVVATMAGGMSLESATGFLVVAAGLLELKSARLLPSIRFQEKESGLPERDLLLARLVECATFREAGAWIAGQIARGQTFHGRAADMEPRYVDLTLNLLARTSVADVAAAAARLLAPSPQLQLDVSHLSSTGASVRSAIVEVAQHLRGRQAVSFDELCGETGERIDVVVRFLALLELFKAGAVELLQAERFGDIRAVWTSNGDTTDGILADVDDYAAASEDV